MTRVGIYARISLAHEEDTTGVDRQVKDCQDYCAKRGYEVADTYVDNNVSAYRGSKRGEYQRMLSDLAEHKIDGVVVYHLDRLHRQPAELEAFLKVADATDAVLGTVTGDVDLGTSDGRFHARIMGAVAKKASDDASRRLQRKWLEDAREGKPKSGGRRPFGYEADKVTLHHTEAAIYAECADRVLNGETVYSVAKDLRERGFTSAEGHILTPSQIRRMLINPRYAGLRVYKGETMGTGNWEVVISESDHEALVALLTNPARNTRGNLGGPKRKYLLSGLLTCAHCGKSLLAYQNAGKASYTCKVGPMHNGCGKVSVVGAPVEEIVFEKVVFMLSHQDADVTAVLAENDEERKQAVQEIAAFEAKLAKLEEDYYVGDSTLSEGQFRNFRDQLIAKIETRKRALKEAVVHMSLTGVPLEEQALREAWETYTLEQKRNIIENLFESITIAPATARGRFNPARVVIVPRWRERGIDGIL